MKFVTRARNFTELAAPNLEFTVERYSFNAMGGPRGAVIQARGAELDLWSLIERLRCPALVYSDKGDATWWGYVAEVQLSLGQWSVGVSIDSMSNAIRVAYEDQSASNTPAITAWAENAQSIAEYGRKELILTTNGSTLTHAEAARDAALARMKFPIPVVRPNPSGGEVSGTIYCRGWQDTLGWTYYDQPAGVEQYVPGGSGEEYNLGAAAGVYAQGFQVSTAWTLKTIGLRLKKFGTPADNFTVGIYSATASLPDAALATAVVAGSAIGTEFDWVTFTLASGLALTASTLYYIVVYRSGADDPANYYIFEGALEDPGYANGGMVAGALGGPWAFIDPSPDMAFRLLSTEDTATQAATIADDAEFVAAVDLDIASGILTNQYRDGYATALYELEELLTMGTSNYRRMLYTIDINRRLRIYEEPAATTAPYLLSKDGSLHDTGDRPVRNELGQVAVWTRLKEVVPPSVDTTLLADPSLMFIEGAEYESATDTLVLTPRGMSDPFDFGSIQDG